MKALGLMLALLMLPSLPAGAGEEHYFVAVKGVEAVPQAPANVSVKAKTRFLELVGARKEFLATLDGAPDPASDANGYKDWLRKNQVRSFSVTINVSFWQRKLEPNPKKGKGGQVLTIHLSVTLVGTAVPDDVLAFGGEGGSTVIAEVGKTLRPREEEEAIDDALNEALSHAVDDAVAKLKVKKRK